MKSIARASVALALAALPASTLAQVTQAYQYDGHGRLTGVTTTGGAGTHTSAYAYDDANNRTYRSQTGTTAYAAILQGLGEVLGANPMFASAAAELEKAAARLMLADPEGSSAVIAASAPVIADELIDPPGLRSFRELVPTNGSVR